MFNQHLAPSGLACHWWLSRQNKHAHIRRFRELKCGIAWKNIPIVFYFVNEYQLDLDIAWRRDLIIYRVNIDDDGSFWLVELFEVQAETGRLFVGAR